MFAAKVFVLIALVEANLNKLQVNLQLPCLLENFIDSCEQMVPLRRRTTNFNFLFGPTWRYTAEF